MFFNQVVSAFILKCTKVIKLLKQHPSRSFNLLFAVIGLQGKRI